MKEFKGVSINGLDTKKYNKVTIITKESFDEYCNTLEKNDRFVSIIRATNLSKIDSENINKKDEVLYIDDNFYKVNKKGIGLTVGYIAIDEEKFIRVYNPFILFVIILFVIFILLLLAPSDRPSDTGIKIDDSSVDWNGDTPNVNGKVNQQENIIIPGFYKFTSYEEAPGFPLYNPSGNTVYFKYNIFKVLSSNKDKIFDTRGEAQAYINSVSVDYKENNENGIYSFIINDTGETVNTIKLYKIVEEESVFKVLCEEVELIFMTDAISPSKQVIWNTYESLEPGEYELKFKIDTYDLKTGSQCYGAIQSVKGFVE